MQAQKLLFLIPFLPFAGFLVNGIAGRRLPRMATSCIAIVGPLGAFAVAVWGTASLSGSSDSLHQNLWSWISVGGLEVPFAFAFDRLAAVMSLVVAGVGTLIHVYSIGYMRDDPGYARFFAYLNLFLSAMLVLVLADNLVLFFLGWEGVGLCSYLLISFWYKDLANCAAGIKAFVVNRIGDLGFLLGIFAVYTQVDTVVFGGPEGINARVAGTAPGALFASALLLFAGATGKSAQIPLFVWLPDAMAGPTPVSALIHAATMVTSGVYMVARLGPLFDASGAGPWIASVGALTALLAAVIAFSQKDIKKVLAYSTVSQLGFMFLAAGVGAYGVAVFHVVTHAFFKALLFLGAGAVIHSLHHEQDMSRMGGLRHRLPQTFAVFLVGALALAGFPLTAGFFSKDEILHAVHGRAAAAPGWLALWALGLVTAFLTAVYTVRQVVLVFFGRYRGEDDSASGIAAHALALEAHGTGHGGLPAHQIRESPWTMRAPLFVLAALSVAGGFLNVPAYLAPATEHGVDGKLAGWLIGGTVAIAGIGAAVALFVMAPELTRAVLLRNPIGRVLYRISSRKFYVDEAYDAVIVRPLITAAELLFICVDRLFIDILLVRGSALCVRIAGYVFSLLQTGRAPTYALWFLCGVLGVLALAILHGT